MKIEKLVSHENFPTEHKLQLQNKVNEISTSFSFVQKKCLWERENVITEYIRTFRLTLYCTDCGIFSQGWGLLVCLHLKRTKFIRYNIHVQHFPNSSLLFTLCNHRN